MLTGAVLVFAITAIPSELSPDIARDIALAAGIGGGVAMLSIMIIIICYVRRNPLTYPKAMEVKATSETTALLDEEENK